MNKVAILITSIGEAIVATITIIFTEDTITFSSLLKTFIINFIISIIVFSLFDYFLKFKLYGTY